LTSIQGNRYYYTDIFILDTNIFFVFPEFEHGEPGKNNQMNQACDIYDGLVLNVKTLKTLLLNMI